jgi:hypothetical protein
MLMRDMGDFQTPPALVHEILSVLGPVGRRWTRVLEPTCGRGNFIEGLLSQDPPPREIRAVELQASHVTLARAAARQRPGIRTEIQVASIFDIDLGESSAWEESGPLLVIGNPPWITNSELSGLGSPNVPPKKNWRKLRGIDAITGRSNFDLAECVWIKVLTELAWANPTVAMLCKSAVARNVLRFAHEQSLPVIEASVYQIDAGKWFGAAVDACFLVVGLGSSAVDGVAKFYPSLGASEPHGVLSISKAYQVADASRYAESSEIDGVCPLPWRQGIKHDAARIMELRGAVGGGISEVSPHREGRDSLEAKFGRLQNKLGEIVDVEPEFLYPLMKGSDLFHERSPFPERFVIVTQRTLTEDTRKLRHEAPRLWKYLTSHVKVFENRKSAVFAGRPQFSLFGVGDYSFAPYKVSVAGFYKMAKFRILGPIHGQPVMVDDTCYFVACHSAEHAALVAALLNDPLCENLMSSLVFKDAKRPIVKAILQRVDLKAILRVADVAALRCRYSHELERLHGDGINGSATEPSRGKGLAAVSTHDEFLHQVMRLI